MALIRPVRALPIKPDRVKLRALMLRYCLSRKTVARLMRCSHPTLDRYLLPETSGGNVAIPLARFELLLMKLQCIYHPGEAMEMAI
jgi:hypothetical protein